MERKHLRLHFGGDGQFEICKFWGKVWLKSSETPTLLQIKPDDLDGGCLFAIKEIIKPLDDELLLVA